LATRADLHERQRDISSEWNPSPTRPQQRQSTEANAYEAGSIMNQDPATPYNRPIPQGGYTARATDPTAAPIATGGSLMLNDADRAALKEWFKDCFKNQFDSNYKATWFGDWFREFFGPMRDRINANFNKAFDTISQNKEEAVKMRDQLRDELRKEIATEIKAAVDLMRKDFNKKMRKEFAAKVKARQNDGLRGEVTTLPAFLKRDGSSKG
jgi:hypothetical protein